MRVDALHGGVAVAPDKSRIAFVADAHGAPHLFVREVRELEAREVRGSAGARDPFFSPDGGSAHISRSPATITDAPG